MIRGRHMDLSILGGMEVSENGDLANWIIPKKMVKGMGGAMDLVNGANRVVITMEHTAKNKKTGEVTLKILENCNLPLTGKSVVDLLITELAVFEFSKQTKEMHLIEIASDTTLEEVKKNTGARYTVSPNLKKF